MKTLTLQPAKPPATSAVELTDAQAELILDALESHAYWQVSESKYRNNGYVYAPGADDPDVAEHLREIDQLSVLLGGEPITGEPEEITYPSEGEITAELERATGVRRQDASVPTVAPGFPEECKSGEHDFDIREGFKLCNRCTQHVPFPNTRDGLLSFLQAETERMLTIARAKNQDYAGDASDPFANFTRVKALGICTPEAGFLTRMTDKLSRIASITASGKTAVKDESVKDTLRDLANYSLLMLAYLESRKDGAL